MASMNVYIDSSPGTIQNSTNASQQSIANSDTLAHYSCATTAPEFRFLFCPVTRRTLTAEGVDSASAASSRRQRPLHACAARRFPTSLATFVHEDVPQVPTAARRRAFSSSDQLTGGAWLDGDSRTAPGAVRGIALLDEDRGDALRARPSFLL